MSLTFAAGHQFLPLKRAVILKARSLRLKDPENAQIFHVRLKGNSTTLDFPAANQKLAVPVRINQTHDRCSLLQSK
jgi:hypothetical protein